MDEQIKQIAERLRGLRDVLELSVDTLVEECELTKEKYETCSGLSGYSGINKVMQKRKSYSGES